MRKTIGASEGSSIYMMAICAGSLLTLFLSLALSKTSVAFAGMSLFSWIGYAIMQLAFIATVLIYAKARKIDEISLARINKYTNWKQMLLIPFIGIATILVFLPLANLWTMFLSVIGYHGSGVSMPTFSNVGIYILSLLLMALLPAIGEELLMRGNVFPALSTRSTLFGVLMSALFFSLMHTNPYQTVHQFGLGIVLALVCILSGSIWPCVMLHFFNNFVSLTLTAYMPFVDVWYAKLGYYNYLVGFVSVVVGLVLLVALLYLFHRFGQKKDEDNALFRVAKSYDNYTIYASLDDQTSKKSNILRDLCAFFKSLFTKQGWKNVSSTLAQRNQVVYIGKNQRMFGVWIALGLVVIYWLYAFIAGMI